MKHNIEESNLVSEEVAQQFRIYNGLTALQKDKPTTPAGHDDAVVITPFLHNRIGHAHLNDANAVQKMFQQTMAAANGQEGYSDRKPGEKEREIVHEEVKVSMRGFQNERGATVNVTSVEINGLFKEEHEGTSSSGVPLV